MAVVARNRYVLAYAQVTGIYGLGLRYREGNFEWVPIEVRARERGASIRAAKSAERRARKLFRSHLTKHQLGTLKRHGWINVRGSHTKQVYRIDCSAGCGNNIYRPDLKTWFCVVLDEWPPRFDHYLAQKLLIETNERKFLKIAVRS